MTDTVTQPLLSLRDLNVTFLVGRKTTHIVRDVNLDIAPHSVVCLIGETGCGKSVTASAILHLLPDNARVTGSIRFKGNEIAALSDREFRTLRGSQIMSIPQNPTTSLDPLMRVGPQVAECTDILHEKDGGHEDPKQQEQETTSHILRLFEHLGLPHPEKTYRRYPSELSGGMNQRVLISMGAITHPDLLVVDEPTKAIDRSLRRNVLTMLQNLKVETSCAMMLITHDIPLARHIADQVAVMYAGRIVEFGPAHDVLDHPIHPYTQGLLDSLPENGFKAMDGFMPSFDELPTGCSFWPRCPYADDCCKTSDPTARIYEKQLAYCRHPLYKGTLR